jgi:histidinol-phosphate aminotransferase
VVVAAAPAAVVQVALHLHRNEHPGPVPATVAAAAARALESPHRYPSPDTAALRGALAAHYGLDPSWIVAGAGSVAVISQVLQVAPAGEVLLPWPSFEAYPALVAAHRHAVVPTPLTPRGSADLDAIRAALSARSSVVVVCSPNTPTGGTVTHRALRGLLAELPPGALLLLDEAYAEYADDPDAANGLRAVADDPRVVVTRTFSKAYGLAGLRVGYGIAQPPLAGRIAAVGMPFAVNAPAEAAAIAALQHTAQMRRAVDRIRAERTRMAGELRARGIPVLEGEANFVWLPLEDGTEPVVAHLAAAGVAVKAYPRTGIRITVGTGQDTDHLLAAWPLR